MKILGISGSKRKKGNTSILVQEALQGAQKEGAKTELIFLGDYAIKGCLGCEGCKDTYRCVIDDDMQKIYPLLLESDGIILGSPTYFYNISADMKAFIDRCYCFEVFAEEDRSCWSSINEARGGKYAAVIAVCEQQDEKDMGFASEAMCLSLQALGYRVIDQVKVFNLFKAGEALNDNDVLRRSGKAGEKLVKTIQLRKDLEVKIKDMDIKISSFSES
ncbi:MAG: flavodoxin family protein [Desulfotomaculaceae bacterium]|nr:flavodoxin family protein [Desulfotomaculaceae bacterium]MDD4766486.1 flavodoxin family protein [Desulfotomaculaceae bacterium]